MVSLPIRRLIAAVALLCTFGLASVAMSQTGVDQSAPLPIQPLPPIDTLTGAPEPQISDTPVEVQSHFTAPDGDRPAMLYVTAKIADGYHIYSITQAPGGPIATTISLEPAPQYSLAGEFTSQQPPTTHIEPEIWPGLPLEEHYGTVTWSAPIEFALGFEPSDVTIEGGLGVQVCYETNCLPPETLPFEAQLASDADAAIEGEYRAEDSAVAIRAYLEPRVVQPGGTAKLLITAVPDPRWHIYTRQDSDPKAIGQGKPTLIAVDAPEGFTVYQPETNDPIVEKESAIPGGGVERYHEGDVTWSATIKVPQDVEPGDYPIQGNVGYQVCLADGACQIPQGARFEGVLTVGTEKLLGSKPLNLSAASYTEAAQQAKALPTRPGASAGEDRPLLTILAFAVLGGLILNLMPCVLPVIGLKVLAFVQQGGESRARVFALNLWYTAGLIAVFLVLASLAAFANLGWGEQFSYLWFKVALTGLVFAMALSFLGVWEIPIPGFATSGKATEMAAREGASGAFYKGVFTTILATPCSAQFLGPALGFTLGKPPYVIYLIFGAAGLGMALPYLVIGAFPRLIRFLPKPGAWMETFKQLMGFLLLGTVVYLFSTFSEAYFIPTLALLVGLWFACWWIGRTPVTATVERKVTAWVGGAATAAAIGFAAFTLLAPGETLPWRSYSPTELASASAQGKTVLVDFTADWCPNCKVNLKFAINTDEVRELVDEYDVVPLLADWTDRSETIKQALAELQSISIPVLAIYPAGRPEEVIVLRDLVSQKQVIEALKQAGPSQPTGDGQTGASATAMNAP
ncbi:MAG: thioredoxin family protein [Pirellulales bacterium]